MPEVIRVTFTPAQPAPVPGFFDNLRAVKIYVSQHPTGTTMPTPMHDAGMVAYKGLRILRREGRASVVLVEVTCDCGLAARAFAASTEELRAALAPLKGHPKAVGA